MIQEPEGNFACAGRRGQDAQVDSQEDLGKGLLEGVQFMLQMLAFPNAKAVGGIGKRFQAHEVAAQGL